MNNLFGDEASEIISNLTLTSICDNLSDVIQLLIIGL